MLIIWLYLKDCRNLCEKKKKRLDFFDEAVLFCILVIKCFAEIRTKILFLVNQGDRPAANSHHWLSFDNLQ